MSTQPLLDVKGLKKYFKTPKGMLHAVDDVTFTIEKGKTLGVVGESGCGKSTTGRAILRLLEPTAGEVLFEGEDVVKLSKDEMRKKRTDMQIIFQDPFSSLNPRKTISQIIADPLKINNIITDKNQQLERVRELMETVGLAGRRTASENRYRQSAGSEPEIYCLRRAGIGSGRFHPGTDSQSDETASEKDGADLHVYYS